MRATRFEKVVVKVQPHPSLGQKMPKVICNKLEQFGDGFLAEYHDDKPAAIYPDYESYVEAHQGVWEVLSYFRDEDDYRLVSYSDVAESLFQAMSYYGVDSVDKEIIEWIAFTKSDWGVDRVT